MIRFTIRFRGWQDRGGNKVPRWCPDPELAANISAWVQLHSDTDEENFARFCLDDLRNHSNSLAARHLSALLENIGYGKSKEIYHNLKNQQNNVNLPPEDSLDQIFQYAWLEAASPANFFRNFKEEEPSLIRYASSTMKGKIKDRVFGKKYLSTTYTGYGLLRKVGEGEKKRKKVLESQGYQDLQLSNLLLAWECFYQICTPNRQHQIEPTLGHWQAIARQYSQLQKEGNSSVNWETVKTWIDNCCIPAANNYLAPQSIAINTENPETGEGIDIPDLSPSPAELLEREEVKEIANKFLTEFAFSEFIKTLKPKDRQLLLLRYGFELIQKDVAEEFNWYSNNKPDNTRVSKAEDRLFRNLAQAILNWMVEKGIARMEEAAVIDSRWLKRMKIKSDCEILIKSYFSHLVNLVKDEGRAAIALNLQLAELEVNDRQAKSHQFLKNYVANQIQNCFDISLPPYGHAATKISSLLEDFLKMPQY